MKPEMMHSEEMVGGKKNNHKEERHFRVCELDGKKVSIGGVTLKHGQSPLNAAMKLLTSIAHEKGLEKMNQITVRRVKSSTYIIMIRVLVCLI